MSVLIYLKKNGVENRSASTNDYAGRGALINQYLVAGTSGKAAEGGTWTVEHAAGSTVCGRCAKTISHPIYNQTI